MRRLSSLDDDVTGSVQSAWTTHELELALRLSWTSAPIHSAVRVRTGCTVWVAQIGSDRRQKENRSLVPDSEPLVGLPLLGVLLLGVPLLGVLLLLGVLRLGVPLLGELGAFAAGFASGAAWVDGGSWSEGPAPANRFSCSTVIACLRVSRCAARCATAIACLRASRSAARSANHVSRLAWSSTSRMALTTSGVFQRPASPLWRSMCC